MFPLKAISWAHAKMKQCYFTYFKENAVFLNNNLHLLTSAKRSCFLFGLRLCFKKLFHPSLQKISVLLSSFSLLISYVFQENSIKQSTKNKKWICLAQTFFVKLKPNFYPILLEQKDHFDEIKSG